MRVLLWVSRELSAWPSQIRWFSWYRSSFYPVWHDICKADSVKKMSIYGIELIQDTPNNVFAIVLTLASAFTASSSEMLPTAWGLVPAGFSSRVNRLKHDTQKSTEQFFREFLIYKLSVCLTLSQGRKTETESKLVLSLRLCSQVLDDAHVSILWCTLNAFLSSTPFFFLLFSPLFLFGVVNREKFSSLVTQYAKCLSARSICSKNSPLA